MREEEEEEIIRKEIEEHGAPTSVTGEVTDDVAKSPLKMFTADYDDNENYKRSYVPPPTPPVDYTPPPAAAVVSSTTENDGPTLVTQQPKTKERGQDVCGNGSFIPPPVPRCPHTLTYQVTSELPVKVVLDHGQIILEASRIIDIPAKSYIIYNTGIKIHRDKEYDNITYSFLGGQVDNIGVSLPKDHPSDPDTVKFGQEIVVHMYNRGKSPISFAPGSFLGRIYPNNNKYIEKCKKVRAKKNKFDVSCC